MKQLIIDEVKGFRKEVRTPIEVQQKQQKEKEGLSVPSRDQLTDHEVQSKEELTSGYTYDMPKSAADDVHNYVLDDPSQELEKELASTRI